MTLRARLERPDAATPYDAGEACHRAGDLAGALVGYDAALTLEPLHGRALHLSAMAFYQQGDVAAALARIEAAAGVLARDADVWSGYGVILAALGRPADAVEAYRRGLVLASGDGVLWFNLGLTLKALGETDEAITALSCAAEALNQAAAHHELAVVLQDAGRMDEAVASYRAALDIGAGADSALNAGAACHALGDPAEAETFFRLALDLDPRCARALNNLAVIAQDVGDHDRASALCRQAIALDPTFEDARNNLGVALSRLGDHPGALEAYRGALGVDPFGAKALANLTDLLFDLEQSDVAVAQARQLTAAYPSDTRAWLAMARVLDRTDDPAGAAEALDRAARLDSRLWEPPHRLGELHQRLGQPMAALPYHRRASDLAPDRPETWRGLALAAIKAGDAETALPALASLLRLDPFDPEAWAYQALALRLDGQIEAADALTDRTGLVAVIPLGPPPGYQSLPAFHEALTADLAAVAARVWSPRGQSVVGGFQTQNDLFAERAPSIQALKTLLDQTVADHLATCGAAVRAFVPVSSRARRYRSWSVTLKAGGRHAPHIHPEGRLSGVYYAATPGGAGSDDLGGLEFGRPGVDAPLPSAPPTRVVRPRAGHLVLFPSYLWHATRTFEADGERVTVAFDLLRA